jgi:uncharacterized membrane protein
LVSGGIIGAIGGIYWFVTRPRPTETEDDWVTTEVFSVAVLANTSNFRESALALLSEDEQTAEGMAAATNSMALLLLQNEMSVTHASCQYVGVFDADAADEKFDKSFIRERSRLAGEGKDFVDSNADIEPGRYFVVTFVSPTEGQALSEDDFIEMYPEMGRLA